MSKVKDQKTDILSKITNRIIGITLKILTDVKSRHNSIEGIIAELEMVNISLRMVIAELEYTTERKRRSV